MPSPSSSLATLRPDLGASLEEFDLAMDRQGFIGLDVLPVIETMKQSGPFGKIPVEELLKKAQTRRAPGSGYARGDWEFETDSYATEEHGFEEPVDDREAEMYAEYFDAELVSAEVARDTVMRAQEERIADLVFNASTFSATSVTNEWDDATNATPIEDVKASKIRVYAACGMWPDSLIISKTVFLNLRECDEIIDRLKYQGFQDVRSAMIGPQALAAVFDLRQVLVGGGTENTASEGQTASFAGYWSNEYAMVAKLARTRSIKEPCLGRTFHWGEDGSQIGTTFESYREEKIRGEVVRARHDVPEKQLYTACGDPMDNTTT